MTDRDKLNKLEAADFTKEDLEKIRSFLPLNYKEIIIEKLNGKVSERIIFYVLSGERPDHHGIIDLALDLAFEEKAKRKAIAKRIDDLNK